MKDFFQQGKSRFFSNYWNYLAIATQAFFILHYVIWWACRTLLSSKQHSTAWENHAADHAYSILLISECFRAVGILLAFVRNFSFIQANSSTGPLLQAFKEMLRDVAKFFFYFFFMFLAFAVSFMQLYSQYEKARKHLLLSSAQLNQTVPLHLERFVYLFLFLKRRVPLLHRLPCLHFLTVPESNERINEPMNE